MEGQIIDLNAHKNRNVISKDKVIGYILKNEDKFLEKFNFNKEDLKVIDDDYIDLDINQGDTKRFSNLAVVCSKSSGRIKIGEYSDMLDYYKVSYDSYNKLSKTSDNLMGSVLGNMGLPSVSFKDMKEDLMLVELPNNKAIIKAMWGTSDWICRLIEEIETNVR